MAVGVARLAATEGQAAGDMVVLPERLEQVILQVNLLPVAMVLQQLLIKVFLAAQAQVPVLAVVVVAGQLLLVLLQVQL
jgi:hypothetical protein